MRTCQVFVSHTSDMATFPETRSFVQATLDAVNRAGMAAVDMRYFAARGGKPADYCRQRVRDCEIYVAVIGFRYGSIVPGETISYTELEFEEAVAAGIPRLVFLLDAEASLPDRLMDSDRRLVDRFRRRLLQAGLVVRSFTSDAGLELEVFHALSEAPSHPAGTADESRRRTREPGKPTAGAGRPPGPADVLTAGQHGRSSPGLGSDGARPAGRPQRRILTITLACAILAAAGVVSFELARSSPPYQGGGVWVHPAAPVAEWGDGPMVLEVQVTNISQVEHINFTGTWPGAGWEILPGCAETAALPYPAGDIYRCIFDPQAAGVPALTNMTLSFDVYGTPANAPPSNLSPNGAHQVSWGWRCTYNPPTTRTCPGW